MGQPKKRGRSGAEPGAGAAHGLDAAAGRKTARPPEMERHGEVSPDAAAFPDATLRTLLLAELSRSPGYGYGLARAVEQQRGGRLTLAPEVLYPVLHKLELDGLAQGAWEQGENGRPRRTYTITPKGRRLADKQARALQAAREDAAVARGDAARELRASRARRGGWLACFGGEVRS